MVVRDLVEQLDLSVLAGDSGLERTVTGGYVGDLLSCVMAGATPGSIWVTVQSHPNIVAVATLTSVAAIIVSEGSRVEAPTLEKATQEGIPVLSSRQPSFEVVAGLVRLGIQGKKC